MRTIFIVAIAAVVLWVLYRRAGNLAATDSSASSNSLSDELTAIDRQTQRDLNSPNHPGVYESPAQAFRAWRDLTGPGGPHIMYGHDFGAGLSFLDFLGPQDGFASSGKPLPKSLWQYAVKNELG